MGTAASGNLACLSGSLDREHLDNHAHGVTQGHWEMSGESAKKSHPNSSNSLMMNFQVQVSRPDLQMQRMDIQVQVSRSDLQMVGSNFHVWVSRMTAYLFKIIRATSPHGIKHCKFTPLIQRA